LARALLSSDSFDPAPALRRPSTSIMSGVAVAAARLPDSLPDGWTPSSSSLPSWCATEPPPPSAQLLFEFASGETAAMGSRRCSTLGSDACCDILIAHRGIAALHAAVLYHRNGLAYIVDLGSAGGTRLDGVPLAHRIPEQLRAGATLCLGSAPPLVVRGRGLLMSTKDLLSKEGRACEGEGEGEGDADEADEADEAVRRNTELNRRRRQRQPLSSGSAGGASESPSRMAGRKRRFSDEDAAEPEVGVADDTGAADWPPRKRPRADLAHGTRVCFSDFVDEIDPDLALDEL